MTDGTKSFLQQLADDMKPHARGGLKDLQDAVVHAFPDSQRQHDVLGMPGSPVPSQVADELAVEHEGPDQSYVPER